MIEARDLTKRYGPTVAVDALSFDVRPGSVTGFLGPNGSGKSTTMRLILGLDRPDAGQVRVGGRRYRDLRWPLREVGALLEARAFHPGRSARSHLTALAASNAIPRARVDEVLDMAGLASAAGRRAGKFSLGMGQRLGVAAALLGDPAVLLLDEPVNGLDPEGVRWIRNLLKSLAAQGRTVFVSSHLISEMALTAERLVVIGRGRLLADTTVAGLSAGSASLEDAFFRLTSGAVEYRGNTAKEVPSVTTTAETRVPSGRYGLAQAARMEWIKLRSLRSTWWTLAVTAAGTVGIGLGVGLNSRNASEDLTNNALAGVVPGLLLAGALGVLTMTSEYSSGTIRVTLAAIPRRPLVLAAKAAAFGAVTLVVGEAASFIAFLAAAATLRHGIAAPTLGQPGVLRAVVLSGAAFCLIGLLGLGLGAIIRHSAAAVGVLVAGVYVAAMAIGVAAHGVAAYMPLLILENSLSTTKPVTCGTDGASCPHFLSAWAGLGVLGLYAAIALAAGGWLLAWRDA